MLCRQQQGQSHTAVLETSMVALSAVCLISRGRPVTDFCLAPVINYLT